MYYYCGVWVIDRQSRSNAAIVIWSAPFQSKRQHRTRPLVDLSLGVEWKYTYPIICMCLVKLLNVKIFQVQIQLLFTQFTCSYSFQTRTWKPQYTTSVINYSKACICLNYWPFANQHEETKQQVVRTRVDLGMQPFFHTVLVNILQATRTLAWLNKGIAWTGCSSLTYSA